jgi:hypothetical protein
MILGAELGGLKCVSHLNTIKNVMYPILQNKKSICGKNLQVRFNQSF